MGSQWSNQSNDYLFKQRIALLETFIEEQKEITTLLKQENEALKTLYENNPDNPNVLEQIIKSFENKDYEYLIFSGGGIKGLAFGSALCCLEKLNIIKYDQNNNLKLKGVAGTSAGSIIASLLGIGYKPIEILEKIKNLDTKKIFSDDLGYIHEGINFVKDYGFCPGIYLMELLGTLIFEKTGNPDYTIDDLYKDKNIKLVIVSTDMNCQSSRYFYPGNREKEYFNIPIRKAVRMSMGIPFQFEAMVYNKNYMVDGGVLDNYPLHVFDGEYPGDPKARLNLLEPNPNVLGIKIMTTDDIPNYNYVPRQEITSLLNYCLSFINMFLVENERRIMSPSYWLRSIIIITQDFPINKSTLTVEEKEELINSGEKFTMEFFNEENNKSKKIIKSLKCLKK